MDIKIVGPVAIREHELKEICHENEGHEHNYDHTTIIISGRVRVIYSHLEGETLIQDDIKEFGQGDKIPILANTRHTIKALEPNTIYHCVFSHRDFDGIVIQEYIGNRAAYQ
jgi:quercetin dioxygenase-like cupin family protein